ncbi:MAG: META domain-containing protein [Scytolyngbya sp. HA4215-MV1]|jgi:putative lipoprotein|nr:META domain-containing protein [Scytolyngbya sp. HA4215-MV1]
MTWTSGKFMTHLSVYQLVNTEWLLEEISGIAVNDCIQTTLYFDSTHHISGHGGCNLYGAELSLRSEAPPSHLGIRFMVLAIAVTQKLCPPVVMEQEKLYFQVLQEAQQLQLEDTNLVLYTEESKSCLRFTQLRSTAYAEETLIAFEAHRNTVHIFRQNGQTRMNIYDKHDRITWLRGVLVAVELTTEGIQYTNVRGETKVVVVVPRSGAAATLTINGEIDRAPL